MRTPWQVATAAEAFAAAQFARCGWDVSVQYGANQPEYDLVAVDGDQLVRVRLERKRSDPRAFTRLVLDCENVHIVTFAENYKAMKHDGDYRAGGIKLVAWRTIPEPRRSVLWRRMLRGRVANSDEFAPPQFPRK